MVNKAEDVVPFGPTTSTGKVTVVAAGDACRIKLAVARTACVAEFVAVIVALV
jgi:hypothetical protein